LKKTFRAVLEPLRGNLGWVIARVPFDATKVWKERKGLRVQGTVNGFAFRSSLFSEKEGGYFLLINKVMQKNAHAGVGAMVEVVLWPDLESRDETVPAELEKIFAKQKKLRAFYDELSPSAKADISKTITSPKSAEARVRQAERMAERFLLTMEGERELPPILRMLFQRHPKAQAGWNAMTAVQRRGHLMGIFYYQGPEAREKRAMKAVEESESAGQRVSKSSANPETPE